MNAKLNRLALIAVLTIVVGLLTPASGLATGPTGTGPDNAMAPSSASVHLKVGQQHWYVFHTDGADANDDPSKVLITMRTSPQGSATFNVWTPEQLKQIPSQDLDNPVKPIGVGSLGAYKQGDDWVYRYGGVLVWAEDAMAGGTFYVQVQQAGSQDSDYVLSITGTTVTFPTATYEATPVASPAPASTAAATSGAKSATSPAPANAPAAQATSAVQQAGTGPETAFATFDQSMTVKPGQQQWYIVTFSGNSYSDSRPLILARLTAQPSGGAKFSVWTPERLHQLYAQNWSDKVEPIGQGTQWMTKEYDDNIAQSGGDLFWNGDARTGGTYYIVVEPSGSAPVDYKLNVSYQP